MAARFEGLDFYDIDALLTEEERMVRDTIRDWVEERLIPVIGDAYVARRQTVGANAYAFSLGPATH